MEHITKPASRATLRRLSMYFRKLFDIPLNGEFPVLQSLEKISDIFKGTTYVIVENDELPSKVMAQCEKNNGPGFTIKIKKMIYDGACKGINAYKGFILHEMCHVFMYEIGYTPILQRTFQDEVPSYVKTPSLTAVPPISTPKTILFISLSFYFYRGGITPPLCFN